MVIINPSMLFSNGNYIRAARAHKVGWERREGEWEGRRVTEELKVGAISSVSTFTPSRL